MNFIHPCILAKGPKVLNDMFEILLRFRLYDKGLISDVSKAYYILLTGELEKHVRRVLGSMETLDLGGGYLSS